ncbi:hypothetical protein H2202_002789 [Exophiala xenobiotica]|nr:hypothetical protein H2202_002789 [Exophiala xenobiotica]KAK5207936.1 hypothetical protein LTR41_006448 [Exophiala xenobiotica]KAK5241050.1 hypothetical protein LTS06_012247 [Exophiala xenobiotica]KAK5278893.1 hypothetical protein LTR40_008547 [Exophiala xenobiotica]KAK5366348.1 hypothetical protein LTS13_008109 [Exophiala xenobiotica]
MADILPPHPGLLPYYLLLTGSLALTHSVVCYTRPLTSMRQYSGPSAPPPSALLSHVYAVQNVYTGFIRILAAYDIENQALYRLAILSFAGVLFLNGSELMIWKTARLHEIKFALGPSALGLVWLITQREWYTA